MYTRVLTFSEAIPLVCPPLVSDRMGMLVGVVRGLTCSVALSTCPLFALRPPWLAGGAVGVRGGVPAMAICCAGREARGEERRGERARERARERESERELESPRARERKREAGARGGRVLERAASPLSRPGSTSPARRPATAPPAPRCVRPCTLPPPTLRQLALPPCCRARAAPPARVCHSSLLCPSPLVAK